MFLLHYRNMFDADGTFNEGHMNNWQHAAMYFAYMISGFVDIIGFYVELPPDSEQVRFAVQPWYAALPRSCLMLSICFQAALGLAFVTEGLLLGFHLKGAPIEVLVHKLLVITIAGSATVMFAEICCKGSVILTLARALLVQLQGIWFIQIGYILFKGGCGTWCQTGLDATKLSMTAVSPYKLICTMVIVQTFRLGMLTA